jgi:hypothetical protein
MAIGFTVSSPRDVWVLLPEAQPRPTALASATADRMQQRFGRPVRVRPWLSFRRRQIVQRGIVFDAPPRAYLTEGERPAFFNPRRG